MAYQINVTISDIEPPIWRRLRVPGSITFDQLHAVIQAAFGWLNYHLYRFEFDGVVVVEDDPDYTIAELWGDARQLDPESTPIGTAFETHARCLYVYDFGDEWVHEIVVEKRLKENKKYATPVCLAGARHRPPEDVGGVGGYAHFMESIQDEDDPEREECLEWAEKDTGGRLFDPEYFHLHEVNRKLEHVLDDTPESAHRLLVEGAGMIGMLRTGWFGPYIEASGQRYTWERLGDLISMLDEGLLIAIKIGRAKRGRRRSVDQG
jgi:hypothetical protein